MRRIGKIVYNKSYDNAKTGEIDLSEYAIGKESGDKILNLVLRLLEMVFYM